MQIRVEMTCDGHRSHEHVLCGSLGRSLLSEVPGLPGWPGSP